MHYLLLVAKAKRAVLLNASFNLCVAFVFIVKEDHSFHQCLFFKRPLPTGRTGDTGRNDSLSSPSALPISFSAEGPWDWQLWGAGRGCSPGSHTTRQASLLFPNHGGQPAQGGPDPATAGESKSKQEQKEHFFAGLCCFSLLCRALVSCTEHQTCKGLLFPYVKISLKKGRVTWLFA